MYSIRHSALLLFLWAASAAATSPCSPNTFLGNPKRPSAAWRTASSWVAVGVVVGREEHKVPFPNCALDDRSACNQWDRSILTIKVERYEKGKGPFVLHLVSQSCAPDPPQQAGGRYRFYGDDLAFYSMYEALPAKTQH